MNANGYAPRISLNNVIIAQLYALGTTGAPNIGVCLPIKKGQTLTFLNVGKATYEISAYKMF